MGNVITFMQIALGILLVVLILLQSRGTGLGSTFGGSMAFYGTKRGAEKMLFIFTIIVSALFLITSIVGVIV